MRKRPANKGFLHGPRKLESFNSADLRGWQRQLLLGLFRSPRGQSVDLKNRKRQNRNRNGLVSQC